jgi:hypothetical protein
MDKGQLTLAILTALTPTVAVFLATLIQRQDVRDLRAEMTGLRKDLHAEMNSFRDDLQTQMISLRNQVHADLLMIHERVAKVEAKQS